MDKKKKATIEEILGWYGADASEQMMDDIEDYLDGKGWHRNEYRVEK